MSCKFIELKVCKEYGNKADGRQLDNITYIVIIIIYYKEDIMIKISINKYQFKK